MPVTASSAARPLGGALVERLGYGFKPSTGPCSNALNCVFKNLFKASLFGRS
jgi:hypothetical protein